MIRSLKLYDIPYKTRYSAHIANNPESTIPKESLDVSISAAMEASAGMIGEKTKSDCRIYITWKGFCAGYVMPLDLVYLPHWRYVEICYQRGYASFPEKFMIKLRNAVRRYYTKNIGK